MENEISKSSRKIPMSVKIGYGAPGYAALFTFTIVITYGMYFFTDVVGFSAGFAGLMLSIGTIWDSITDPIVGMWTDKKDPKKGRRRPFMLGVAIPFGIISWLLFTDFGLGQTATKIYFLLLIIAYYTVQTVLDVPYTALGSEMTTDYDERTSLGSIRNFWVIIGGIATASTFALVAYFTDITGSAKSGWSITNGIFAAICTITILIGWKATKGWENTEASDSEGFNFKNILNGPLKNKSFLYVAGAYMFAIIAQTVAVSCMVYYFIYNLKLTDGQVSFAMTSMWVVGLGWVYLIDYWSRKYSKKASWSISMGIWILALIVFPWFINQPGNLISASIMTAIYVVGYSAVYQITWAMIPDCVEVDEFKTGQRREGLYYAVASFLQKAASAIAFSICGIVINYIGYVPDTIQSARTLFGFKMIFSFGTIIFLVLSILFALFNPMTRERHSAITKAIRLRKEEKEFSTEPFKKLL